MILTVGSLFTGYGGLDMAVEAAIGGRTIWTSDIDPGACKIIAHRLPGVPNLGDITKIRWLDVPPVDLLTGGFPCQDVSPAGKRRGLRPGTRSGLWQHMAYAIDQLRPRLVVIENVRGLLSATAHSDVEPCLWCVGGAEQREPDLRALGAVLGDLASLGYDARWVGLRAADVGAPHGRFRVFIVATDADSHRRDRRGGGPESSGARHPTARHPQPDSDATREPWRVGDRDDVQARRGTVRREPTAGRGSVADTLGGGRERGREDGQRRASDAAAGLSDPTPAEPARLNASRTIRDGDRDGGRSATQDTDSATSGERRQPTPRQTEGRRTRADASRRSGTPTTDADDQGPQGPQPTRRPDLPDRGTPTDAESATRRDAESKHLGAAAGPTTEPRERARTDWGPYAPAIRRWESVLGRLAPPPTERSQRGTQRLAPRFVEWMMGPPEGWVTDVPGLSRNEQLKALGNGVVPQQAAAALTLMLSETGWAG